MRENIFDICCIVVLIAIIIAVGIHIYNSTRDELDQYPEEMFEVPPQEEIEEEKDELVISEYEIDGRNYDVIAILNIPTLQIEYPVFATTSKELLKVSLNKYWGPNPNKKGNFCVLGHNYNDDRFFGKLNKINIGDVIQLTDMTNKTLQYYVYDTYIVNPDDTTCTSQLTDGKTEITLITCTKDFKQRFIVKARAEK